MTGNEFNSIPPIQDGHAGKTDYVNRLIANEISTLTRYYDQTIQFMPRNEDTGALLLAIDSPEKSSINDLEQFPDLKHEYARRTAILLNGVLNHHFDIQSLLSSLSTKLSRSSRLVVVMYNPYLAWIYRIANLFQIRTGPLPTTFITRTDLRNIARLSGYKLIRTRMSAYIPWKLAGIGDFLNKALSITPILRWFSFAYIAVLQPINSGPHKTPSLSIVIPARNEKGNIENALKQMPEFPCDLEIIYVEGHSNDETWSEIQRVQKEYTDKYKIKCFQQTGVGKVDAVRLGFSKAENDLLTILDADLTMPPELLGRFYDAYCRGHADFINGSRLVYPMEGGAMQFLNRIGNSFFARALSWVLDTPLGDSLCGTKLVSRRDYERFIAWRNDFGDFDPFGDYELLFPAAVLGLGIIDIPIRYRSRTYGSTNISRFRHGIILLKMTLVGLFRIKLPRT